jgi:hypothetical protein
MSAFTKVDDIQFTDAKAIVAALKELGYVVEEHDTAVPLNDYCSRPTASMGNIIVRHKHLRGCVNDLGFLKTGKSYELTLSQENIKKLQPKIKQVYTKHAVLAAAKKRRWTNVKVTGTVGSQIRIRMERYV